VPCTKVDQRGLHHGKGFPQAKVSSFGKELPHDVSNIQSPLLCDRTTEKPMCHRLHQMWTVMGATFVNLHRDLPASLIINCHNLINDQPKLSLFLCLSFVPNDIPFRESGRENLIPPLMWNQFLESLLLSNPFASLLCQIRKEWSKTLATTSEQGQRTTDKVFQSTN
jgi:hypothetical protein